MDFSKLKNKSDNFYSQALFIIGWAIIVLGVIGSIVLASASYEFSGAIFFVGLFSTAISGFLILGIAEIINILNDDRKLLTAITRKKESPNESDDAVAQTIADELPDL